MYTCMLTVAYNYSRILVNSILVGVDLLILGCCGYNKTSYAAAFGKIEGVLRAGLQSGKILHNCLRSHL